jgi:hypothetical protein
VVRRGEKKVAAPRVNQANPAVANHAAAEADPVVIAVAGNDWAF